MRRVPRPVDAVILGLRTVVYPAPALDHGKRWYAQILGVEPYFDERFYVGFAVGGFELGLVPDGVPGTSGPQPLWGVDDIESTYTQLLALGARPLDPITAVGEGIRVAAVEDPFGNRLGLIENPHFNPAQVR